MFRKVSLILLLWWTPLFAFADLGQSLHDLPVQDGGRIKPFMTFARENLQLIHGKSYFKTPGNKASGKKSTKRSASEIVFTWMLVPEQWLKVPIVQIRHSGLKEALGYSEEERVSRSHYTPEELLSSERLSLLIQELNNKRQAQEKLDPYFQAVQGLENKLSAFQFIRLGHGLRVLPPSAEDQAKAKNEQFKDKWLAVSELKDDAANKFAAITKSFAAAIGLEVQENVSKEQQQAALDKIVQASKAFQDFARQQNPELYSATSKVKLEIHLLKMRPFMWTWILYLLASVFIAAALFSHKDKYRYGAWILFALGLVIHTYGMLLRSYLVGRPPVSNMYETVVWVPWVTIILAMIFERIKKTNMVFLGAGLVGTLCLILSDMAPVVLDPTLSPLEPVLRDNFWLMVHVLVIVSSYSAFFLAFILGDLLLIYFLHDEVKHKKQIKDGVQAIYRSIQVGVVLLTIGLITGGIWADYSWGRFWGWDPKETWALIALLGYLAMLHARLVGWLRDFGMAAWAVISFSLVIMAWYGVNFVLGAGLHTYGFGAGGVEYVSAFVALHLLFTIYVTTVRQSRNSDRQKSE